MIYEGAMCLNTGFKNLAAVLVVAFSMAVCSGTAFAKAHKKTTKPAAVKKIATIKKVPIVIFNPKNPKHRERLHKAVLHIESHGNRYADDGKTLLTSKRGALGEMQVMPVTFENPGYGVTPAASNSPDEYARVGCDYADALLKKYKGNANKTLAAYNAGAKKVGKAVIKAKRNKKPEQWLAYMPPETRNYVRKGIRQIQHPSVQLASIK